MKTINILIFIILAGRINAQEIVDNPENNLTRNLSLHTNLGISSIIDRQISEHTYSGTTTCFGLSYLKMHQTYGSLFKFNYENSSDIKYRNTSAAIHNILLSYGKMYPINGIKLFNRNLYTLLGPSTDMFFHLRTQNSSLNIMAPTVSYTLLFSLSFNSIVVYPINNKIACEADFSVTAISFGSRFPNIMYKEINLFKLLPFYKGLRNSDRIALSYHPFSYLKLKCGYEFNLFWIKSFESSTEGTDWASLRSVNNYGFLEIAFNF